MARSTTDPMTVSFKKKTSLPLVQLVEEAKRFDVPNHLLETKIYTKLQSNSILQAEPSVLHFRGFQLGKVYQQVLKLINISSEVINIHIIPTQTKYFETKYLKKHRLVPGLCCSVEVHFCADEWRYFYDCIRIHCKGDENLLVPVHAYPVINDLHIPSHISLSSVPLGQSISHPICLSCSCPVDFEFQVHCIQPHKAFTVQPLSGVVPARGEVEIIVTFTPLEYGTAQTILQLVISQFNSKPYLCTITGTSSPYLAIRQLQDAEELMLDPQSLSLVHLSRAKRKGKPSIILDKSKVDSEKQLQKDLVNISSHGTVAKLLIQRQDKMKFKHLHEDLSYVTMVPQMRQMKEAQFEDKVCHNVQEERANHLRWQVHLGKDPVSTLTRKQILEERQKVNENLKTGDAEENFARIQSRITLQRVHHIGNQLQVHAPVFHVLRNTSLEIRHRALCLFQQAARKVVICYRMDRRLASLRPLIQIMKRESKSEISTGGVGVLSCPRFKDLLCEEHLSVKLSEDNLMPFTFPAHASPGHVDELPLSALVIVPATPVMLRIKPKAPLFKLKIPQLFQLKGYQPMSAFEAMSYVPHSLTASLRTGAQDELLPTAVMPCQESSCADQEKNDSPTLEGYPGLTFTTPSSLLQGPHAHSIRIFNPAPGLHAFKLPPSYLECDLDFHLCPLPKYAGAKNTAVGLHTPSAQKKVLDITDMIREMMTWKKFHSVVLSALSSPSNQTRPWLPQILDCYNSELLPEVVPTPLHCLPVELKEDLMDGLSENTDLSITPEMVKAEFAMTGCSLPRQRKEETAKDERDMRQQQLERNTNSLTSKTAAKVQERLNQMMAVARPDFHEWPA